MSRIGAISPIRDSGKALGAISPMGIISPMIPMSPISAKYTKHTKNARHPRVEIIGSQDRSNISPKGFADGTLGNKPKLGLHGGCLEQ